MNGSNVNEGYELWVEMHKEWTKGIYYKKKKKVF